MPKKNRSPLTKPLTRKRLKKELKAAGRLAVGPEQRILKQERRASKVQSRRIRDWFPQYGKAIGKAAERTAGAYQGADEAMGQSAQRSTDFAEQMRQKLAAEAQSSANLRGVQTDTSGSLTNVQAQIARQSASNTLRGVTQVQGAAQQAMFADRQRIGEREKVEQLLREQARRRSYTGDLRALARQKGDVQLQERGRLRDSERDYKLGLMAAREGGKNRRFQAKQAKKDRKAGRKDDKRSRQYLKLQDKLSNKGGGGKQKGGGNRGDRRQASAYLRQGVNVNKLNRKNKGKAVDYLINRGVDPKVARAVVARALKGGKKGKMKSLNPGDRPGGR